MLNRHQYLLGSLLILAEMLCKGDSYPTMDILFFVLWFLDLIVASGHLSKEPWENQ